MMSPRKGAASYAANDRMINDLVIHNFKCFKNVELKGLKRFNVLVGRNAGGKTAFLESLFLLAGMTAQISLKVRAFRGMGAEVHVGVERGAFEGLWRDLFHGFDETGTIEIAAAGSDGNSRSLSVARGATESVALPFGPTDPGELAEVRRPLSFTWVKANGEAQTAVPLLTLTEN